MNKMKIDNSIESLMNKIKHDVEKRKNIINTYKNKRNTNLVFTPQKNIINKRDIPFVYKDIYEYSDFTKFQDIEFIKNLYKGILRREVDSNGLEYYLKLLRSGDKSKSEIVSLIRYSKEGRRKNIKILGSKKRFFQAVLYKVPLIGYMSKIFITICTLPRLLKRLNSYESYIAQESIINYKNDLLLETALHQKTEELEEKLDEKVKELEEKLDEKVKELEEKLDEKVKELEEKLDKKVEEKDFELYLETVYSIKEYMRNSQKKLQDLINEAEKRLPREILNEKELLTIVREKKHKYDSFYVEFEDKFRGSREDIKQRVKVYLPYIEKLLVKSKENIKILDIGCGRGEWIELLTENGYSAKGIDINRVMVDRSKKLGLDVLEADAIEYLQTLKNESLTVVTGFHIIEHLSFDILMKLFEESYRVLKKGGMIIFETPNPENIIVGACNFYIDPTHKNPIPPVTSKFIAEKCNFKDVKIKYLNGNFGVNFTDKFIDNQFGSQLDYAVIAYK
ncbi:methyltransferase domain-containing protein [Hydrogenimonas thermophila]|uniref:O-antigen chain-terminating methyltransferase n=1 Tax=Hydrogenimonas thermophila TaxID=223786 RepID=A0A1I5KSB5_9BACT|nr:methyltransferase domain-containing protein [Hydrogenimonas thermophila]SFO87887.1 O-antigen chain-terminating methyltransferase [Hydrogenimonas thermophila]